MFRTIRVRLVLSYAGIALLVTLSLGAVLLFRLRAYYANMEMDYLNGNAKAMSALAAPMLMKNLPEDVQAAQVSSMAFLAQTRVRILDPRQNLLADSGPTGPRNIGLGVVGQSVRREVNVKGGLERGAASVIIVQNGPDVPFPGLEERRSAPVPEERAPAGEAQPDVLYFSADVPISSGVYGLYLSGGMDGALVRSDQRVLKPILDASGAPLGFVELSEGPAYGREIVNSVASGLAVAGVLAILLAVIAGWLTSRRLTAPLLHLTDATQQMSGGNLSVRVAEAARADEYGSLGKSFNQMAGRIEETVQTLRRFLADAAHELQTPLTALRTNLELARDEPDSAAAGAYLTNALEQIDRLQRLVKDLLNLSHLESGNGQETFEPVDLNDLIRQTCEPFAARAEQAGIAFDLDLPPGEARVRGSAEKLCSALGNLLDNAVKFTPPGGAITVRLRPAGETLRLSVSDTGIGIPAEEIQMLFNRFHRGRNAANYPGSGLGLAIVRAVAERHGGSVGAENNRQGGASFTVVLLKFP